MIGTTRMFPLPMLRGSIVGNRLRVECGVWGVRLLWLAGFFFPLVAVAAAHMGVSDPHRLMPGIRLEGDIVFDALPKGETALVRKPGEYMLRYDERRGSGAFNFFVSLDGKWESRVSCAASLETGRVYHVAAGWDGCRLALDVDGRKAEIWRLGRPDAGGRTVTTNTFAGRVANLSIRQNPSVKPYLGDFRTAELMPREGRPATLLGTLGNYGALPFTNGAIRAFASPGCRVTPARIEVGMVAHGAEIPMSWTVEGGTNAQAYVHFEVWGDARRVVRCQKRVVFMPEREPVRTGDWNPPLVPGRTFHVDANAGNDARDGLTPETAWRSFTNINGRVLGPGERLLLRRGSVFNDELKVTAHGRPDNWAEIGAYGTGPRPTIRRNRFIGDRCAHIVHPTYLAVRDLVVCNAGKGLDILCDAPGCRGILVERCLAHHIEGLYRPNSHGIPEWRDCVGAPGVGNAGGISVFDAQAKEVTIRDCEMYQCSRAFAVSGGEVVMVRVFCHDNACPNTSPHPLFTATTRAWLLDSIFDAAGWSASAGTMGLMLANNDGLIIRNCHFLNQPDSGSGDEGGIDFECGGENCLIDRCTFRNNAGCAIEVLGLQSPQVRNLHITRCRFIRNNWAHKLGPSEIFVWGASADPRVVCSGGRIADNVYTLAPGVAFYTNRAERTWQRWTLADNRPIADAEEPGIAFSSREPPQVDLGAEIWSDDPQVTLIAAIGADRQGARSALEWEQLEGPGVAAIATPATCATAVTCPVPGDYRFLLNVSADGLWRTARTAVHLLPPGSTTAYAWTFARDHDTEGWAFGDLGTAREYFPAARSILSTYADPVHHVGGDYFVLAIKNAACAHLLSADNLALPMAVDTFAIRCQNHTDATRMRLSYTTADSAIWRSCDFPVRPFDDDDTVYRVALDGKVKPRRLRLDFSAGEVPATGTIRIDYMWLGCTRRRPLDS